MSTAYEFPPQEENPFAKFETAPPLNDQYTPVFAGYDAAPELRDPKPRPDRFESAVSRRTILCGAIGAGILSATVRLGLTADSFAGIMIYGGGPPEIGVVPDAAAERKFPNHFNIVGGGFGVYDIEGLASHVHDGLKGFGQTAYVKNSNSGLQIDAQKHVLLNFLEERNAEVVNLYGHSMDGMEMHEIGAFLLEHDIKVQSLLLDCTPETKYNVRAGKLLGAEILAEIDRLSEDLGVSGGPGSRVVFEIISRLLDGRRDWNQIVKEALAKTGPENASDRLIEDQAHYMCAFDGSEFGAVYSKSTAIGKLRPKNWNADQTVDNEFSLFSWRSHAFPHLSVDDLAVIGGGHANPGAAGVQYTPTLMRYATEKDFYDGTTATLMSPNRRAK